MVFSFYFLFLKIACYFCNSLANISRGYPVPYKKGLGCIRDPLGNVNRLLVTSCQVISVQYVPPAADSNIEI